MATYATDLTTFSNAESGTWYELTAVSPEAWNIGDNPAAEADYFIQGAGCRSSDTNNKTGICSGVLDMGSDQASLFTSGSTVVLIWHVLLPGNAMDTYANDGIRVVVGSALTDFWWWTVGGRDKGRNPYGGWQNFAVDPSKTAGRTSVGSPSGAYRYFGAASDVTSNISKGTMHGWDAIRYGRGQISAVGTGCTFAGMAQYNDYNDVTNGYNRFGLFQEQGGSYLWKGLMSLGTSGSSVTFSDSARSIFVDDAMHTYPTFNKIEISNASSSVTWNNISFTSLGTYAPGVLEVVNDCTFILNQCVFSGFGTFTFDSLTDATSCVFYRSGAITAGQGSFLDCQVLESSVAADASAFIWNDAVDPDGYIDGMTFSKGSLAHHAINFGASALQTIHLNNITFTNFNASDAQNDSVLYFSDTGSNVTWNVYAAGCNGTISYKKARSGDTVNVIINPVTFYVYVKDAVTKTNITGARVLVKAADGTGPYPYQESVSISRSGTTVTVSHTGHGMAQDDWVVIDGCTQGEYNGAWQIDYIGADSYSYEVSTTPSSPATGSPIATFALICGTTSAGVISDSRSWTGDQNVDGVVRYAAGEYKQASLSATVDSETGGSATVLLVKDT